MTGPPGYVAALYRKGPRWDDGRLPLEQESIPEHLRYLRALTDAGVLMLSGTFHDPSAPFEEDAIALAIVDAHDVQSAEDALGDDPALGAGVLVRELRTWFAERV